MESDHKSLALLALVSLFLKFQENTLFWLDEVMIDGSMTIMVALLTSGSQARRIARNMLLAGSVLLSQMF